MQSHNRCAERKCLGKAFDPGNLHVLPGHLKSQIGILRFIVEIISQKIFPGLALYLFSLYYGCTGKPGPRRQRIKSPADQESLKVFTEEVRLPVLALMSTAL